MTTTATETLTIHLPAAAAHRLSRIAELSQRSVDEVVAATLSSSLPPLLEDVPPAFREDLTTLETLPTEVLRQQMQTEYDPEQLKRYDALLAENAAGNLDEASQQKLAKLRMEADRLMFRKAYAALLLKWRGQRVPTLAELEVEP
jgi:hypothetical protein